MSIQHTFVAFCFAPPSPTATAPAEEHNDSMHTLQILQKLSSITVKYTQKKSIMTNMEFLFLLYYDFLNTEGTYVCGEFTWYEESSDDPTKNRLK